MTECFLRIYEVVKITGLPRATIYERMAAGKFPRQIRISPRLAAWSESEIAKWQRDRIAERDGAVAA